MLILDPQKNRQGSVMAFLSKLGTPEVLKFFTKENGVIKGVLVEAGSAAIATSHMSPEARGRLPELGPTKLGQERVAIGFVIQRTGSKVFLRGVLNTATGEGVLEACDSPLKEPSQGGMALPVVDGSAAGVTVPYP